MLEQLKYAKAKRPNVAKKKKVLFHHDNDLSAHTSLIAVARLHKLHFDLIPYSPDSPDLILRTVSNIKKWLTEKDSAHTHKYRDHH